MRFVLVLAVTVAAGALAAHVAATSAAAPPNARVCKQIKGPRARYLSRVSGFKSAGSTWTVLATGVDCGYAVKQTPALLKQWTKAKLGAPLRLAGARCLKMIDTGYSGSGTASGGFMCRLGTQAPTSVFGQKTFAGRETAPYTIAQIKAFFGIR
jgi:hypothetical protein